MLIRRAGSSVISCVCCWNSPHISPAVVRKNFRGLNLFDFSISLLVFAIHFLLRSSIFFSISRASRLHYIAVRFSSLPFLHVKSHGSRAVVESQSRRSCDDSFHKSKIAVFSFLSSGFVAENDSRIWFIMFATHGTCSYCWSLWVSRNRIRPIEKSFQVTFGRRPKSNHSTPIALHSYNRLDVVTVPIQPSSLQLRRLFWAGYDKHGILHFVQHW